MTSAPHHPRGAPAFSIAHVRQQIDWWLRALSRMWAVILALAIREMKIRYGRSKLGYAMAFVGPAIQKGLLVTLMTFMDRTPGFGTSYILFYWTGLSGYHCFSFISSRVGMSFRDSKNMLSLPIVRPMDFVLARVILEFVTNMIIVWIGFALIYIFDTDQALPDRPMRAIEAIALLTCLGFGVGVIVSLISVFIPTFIMVWRAMSFILFVLSGVFKLPDFMPPMIMEYLSYNPVLHGVILFREAFYSNYDSYILDVDYLRAWAFSALMVALLMERVLRRRVLLKK